jgi:hypothetical protein
MQGVASAYSTVNAGKRMSEVIEGTGCGEGNFQLSIPWETVAMRARSTTNSTVLDGTRPDLDRRVLRSSQTGCHVLACLDRTNRVSP